MPERKLEQIKVPVGGANRSRRRQRSDCISSAIQNGAFRMGAHSTSCLPVGSGASYPNALGLGFFICKMGIRTETT